MATLQVYGRTPMMLANKEADWDTDDIRLALVTSSYTPDLDAHNYWDDVVANDMAASGDYTANGVALSGKTLAYNATGNITTLDAADWSVGGSSAVSGSFRYGVVYDRTPASDATRPLICYIDFGAQTVTSGTVTAAFNASGIITFTVA